MLSQAAWISGEIGEVDPQPVKAVGGLPGGVVAAHISCRFLPGLLFLKPSLVSCDLLWKILYSIALPVSHSSNSVSLLSAWHQEATPGEAIGAQHGSAEKRRQPSSCSR